MRNDNLALTESEFAEESTTPGWIEDLKEWDGVDGDDWREERRGKERREERKKEVRGMETERDR